MAAVPSSFSAGVVLPEKPPLATCDACLPEAVAALNLQSSSSTNRTSDTETCSSEANTSEGTDSGYASAFSTPIKGPSENSVTPEISDTCPDLQPEDGRRFRWPSTPKLTKAKTFNKPIHWLTQNRFHDLTELFGKHLIEYLAKEKVDVAGTWNISMKLKLLGEDEATARPCVIVLCNASESKKVKKFFRRKSVKSQYQPCDPSPEMPYLEVVVWTRPPRLIASIGDVYLVSVDCKPGLLPLGGTPIKVCQSGIARFATLGGIVVVRTSLGTVSFYGMSAGHIIAQENPKDRSRDRDINDGVLENSDDDNGGHNEEDDDALDLENFELDVTFQQDHGGVATNLIRGHSKANEDRDEPWRKIGHVSKTSRTNNLLDGSPDFDWSLIDITSFLGLNPKLLNDAYGKRQATCYQEKSLKCNRPVMAFCGMSGHRKGILSTTMSYLAISPSEKFVKTYDLTLTDGTILQDGDSGSWVVDTETDEVYGHVVTADDFGEAQVMPLKETLRDMRLQLSAASVGISTVEDIRNYQQWQQSLRESFSSVCDGLPSYSGRHSLPIGDVELNEVDEPPTMIAYCNNGTALPRSVKEDAEEAFIVPSSCPTDSGYSSLGPSPNAHRPLLEQIAAWRLPQYEPDEMGYCADQS